MRMHDDDLTDADLRLVELLSSAPVHDVILDGIVGGFGVEQASEVLARPDWLAYLRTVVAEVAPGRGWLAAATEDGEVGRLNRELLHQAMDVRAPFEAAPRLRVRRDATLTRVTPPWPQPTSADQTSTLRLTGGHATWSIDNLELPPALRFPPQAQPGWVEDLYDQGTAAAIEQGSDSVRVPPLTGEPHPLGRLALGAWLLRWHPGTADPAHPFDEELLRAELGTIAWRHADLLGSTQPARDWLDGTGEALTELARRAGSWSGWRRRLADEVLREARAAQREFAPVASPIRLPMRPSRRVLDGGLALVAGDVSDGSRVGHFAVDPRLVPPRSVEWSESAGLWEITDEGAGPQLHLLVGAGDRPVPGLDVTLELDGEVFRLRLDHGEDGYELSRALRFVPVEVHADVGHPDFPGPVRTAAEVAATHSTVSWIVDERRELFREIDGVGSDAPDLLARPFVAELTAWDPGL